MKRSKLFLGATTCVLAVVAFAAAKTSKFIVPKLAYYTAPGGNCTAFKAGFSGTIVDVSNNTRLTTKFGRQLYQRKTAPCSQSLPLYTTTGAD